MRFRLRTLLILVAFVGAFFAGRASLLPLVKEHQRQNAMHKQQITKLENERAQQEAMSEMWRTRTLEREQVRQEWVDAIENARIKNRGSRFLGPAIRTP